MRPFSTLVHRWNALGGFAVYTHFSLDYFFHEWEALVRQLIAPGSSTHSLAQQLKPDEIANPNNKHNQTSRAEQTERQAPSKRGHCQLVNGVIVRGTIRLGRCASRGERSLP